jgi:3-oxoacyl-[acyl-carrier-protein] synthase III
MKPVFYRRIFILMANMKTLLYCPNPQVATEANKHESGYTSMRGNEVFKVAVNTRR